MTEKSGPIPQNGILLSHILQSVGLEIPTPPIMPADVKFVRIVPPTMPNLKSENKLTIPWQTQTDIKEPRTTGIGPSVPPDIKTESTEPMFLTKMHRLGLQVFLQSDEASIDAIETAASTANSTAGSDTGVMTAKQPKRAKRQVILPTFKTKRLELIRNNKPHYSYEPKILKTWKNSDYLKHNRLYKDNVYIEAEPKHITCDFRRLKKERTIYFKTPDLSALKQGMKPIHRTDRWWIVSDTKVLLDDMKFIDKLVKQDLTCKMRLPYEALHDLSAMTAKRRPAWMRMPARRVVQYLDSAVDRDQIMDVQGLVQNEDLLDSPVATDAVLNCCLHLTKLYYYVIVISDDKERKKRAASIDINCYTLDEVKKLVQCSFIDKYTNSPKLDITVKRNFDSDSDCNISAYLERLRQNVVVIHGTSKDLQEMRLARMASLNNNDNLQATTL